MFKAIKAFFSKMIHTEHTVRVCEGERWVLRLYKPWRKQIFTGKIIGISFEIEDKQKVLGAIAFRAKYYPAAKKAAPIRRGFLLSIQLGNGAGYVWGRTMWFGRNCKAKQGLHAGFTGNGNATPIPAWWS